MPEKMMPVIIKCRGKLVFRDIRRVKLREVVRYQCISIEIEYLFGNPGDNIGKKPQKFLVTLLEIREPEVQVLRVQASEWA